MHTIRYNPPERRKHARTQLHLMLHGIRLDPDGGNVQDTLQMLDISRTGMGALSDRYLYPGQRVVLCLPLHPDGGRRNLYAAVVRCQKGQEGFRIGLEFDHMSLDSIVGCSTSAAVAA